MKNKIAINCNGATELSKQELLDIYGGDFFGCDPSNCVISYGISVLLSLVIDNIEHPIGAAAGYPPK
jgi:hypothetical protein